MNYKFPHITNISQVLAAIQNRPEFIVAEKSGDYTVINYMVSTDSTFPPVGDETAAILRECRGIIFRTSTGEILHRRLQKFFNANEREETQADRIDFGQPHVILEKLDGSMITPVYTSAGVRWGTKMGVTDVALKVEEFIVDHPQYTQLALACHAANKTSIFEWCSRKQRIVVDYPEDRLVLIAIRDNVTGEYSSYDQLVQTGVQWAIPVVQHFPGTADSMAELIAATRDITEAEGFILRFEDGHMVKVKSSWYLQLHKAKDAIRFEKNVIQLILSEKLDDAKAFLLEADRVRVEAYQDRFWAGVLRTADQLEALFRGGYTENRRDFAVDFALKQPHHVQSILFEMFKGRRAVDVIKQELAGSTGSQTKVDEARWMHGATWQDQAEE